MTRHWRHRHGKHDKRRPRTPDHLRWMIPVTLLLVGVVIALSFTGCDQVAGVAKIHRTCSMFCQTAGPERLQLSEVGYTTDGKLACTCERPKPLPDGVVK